MARRRQEIEAFVRHLVVEVEAAEAAGMTAPQAIADHFNAKGVTTRKGRRWTGATVAKFLSSPGAKRYRSGGKAGRTVEPKGNPDKASNALDKARLRRISELTIGHYDRTAEDYWDGTRNHDVSQNYEALLEAIEGDPPMPSSTWVVGPDETCVISGRWAMTPRAWTGRWSSSPWRAAIPGATFCTRIFSRWYCRKAILTACSRMRRYSMCRARNCRGFCLNSPQP